MFTGIIEERGQIVKIEKKEKTAKITIEAKKILEDIHLGDSIAVNGVCLTASFVTKNSFTADVMSETMSRSNLGILQKGNFVNLERAMLVNRRFGGHIVSGHVDGMGVLSDFQKDGNAVWVTVKADKKLLKYVVEKGSIAIDGISLTVAFVDEQFFKVSVIPHTACETILLQKKVGDTVNLECDIVGKYVEKLLFKQQEKFIPKEKITLEFLKSNGF